jgi:hypothetical protein
MYFKRMMVENPHGYSHRKQTAACGANVKFGEEICWAKQRPSLSKLSAQASGASRRNNTGRAGKIVCAFICCRVVSVYSTRLRITPDPREFEIPRLQFVSPLNDFLFRTSHLAGATTAQLRTRLHALRPIPPPSTHHVTLSLVPRARSTCCGQVPVPAM